jgi:hypothetical protein
MYVRLPVHAPQETNTATTCEYLNMRIVQQNKVLADDEFGDNSLYCFTNIYMPS